MSLKLPFSYKEFLQFHQTLQSKIFMRVHIAKFLVLKGLVSSIQAAFDEYLQGDVESEYFNLEDEIRRCAKMRTVCCLAHPMMLLRDQEVEFERLTRAFRSWGAMGLGLVEVEHPSVTAAERGYLYQVCSRFGFQPSVGSDFHNEERAKNWGAGLGNERGWQELCKHFDGAQS